MTTPTATVSQAPPAQPGEALTRRAVTAVTIAIVLMTFAFSLGNVTRLCANVLLRYARSERRGQGRARRPSPRPYPRNGIHLGGHSLPFYHHSPQIRAFQNRVWLRHLLTSLSTPRQQAVSGAAVSPRVRTMVSAADAR